MKEREEAAFDSRSHADGLREGCWSDFEVILDFGCIVSPKLFVLCV